jgi:hypothetical protein
MCKREILTTTLGTLLRESIHVLYLIEVTITLGSSVQQVPTTSPRASLQSCIHIHRNPIQYKHRNGQKRHVSPTDLSLTRTLHRSDYENRETSSVT